MGLICFFFHFSFIYLTSFHSCKLACFSPPLTLKLLFPTIKSNGKEVDADNGSGNRSENNKTPNFPIDNNVDDNEFNCTIMKNMYIDVSI